MEPVTPETPTEFLKRLGENYSEHPNTTFYLLSGGVRPLRLGNPCQTLDIDQQQQHGLHNIRNFAISPYALVSVMVVQSEAES